MNAPQYNLSMWAPQGTGAHEHELAVASLKLRPLPPGTLLGKPFRCFASGQVYCRYTGQKMGPEGGWTNEQVHAMVAHFNANKEPVGLDLDHMSFLGSGEVLGLYAVDETEGELAGHTSLWAVPAYNRLGMEVVSHAYDQRLYTSPTITLQESFDPRTGAKQPAGLIVSVALTFSPAQKQGSVVSAVEFSAHKGAEMKKKSKYVEPTADEQLPVGDAPLPEPEPEAPIPEEDMAEGEPESPEGGEVAPPEEGESPEGSESPEGEGDCQCPEGEADCECPEAPEGGEAAEQAPLSANKRQSLLAQLSILRTENENLRKVVLGLGAEKAVNRLLSEGKITPAEKATATKAYFAEYAAGVQAAEGMAFRPYTEVFATRSPNAKVDYSVVTKGLNPKNNSLDAQVASYSEANKVPYHVALTRILASK